MNLFQASTNFLSHRKNLKLLRIHNNILLRKIMITKLNQMKILTRCFNSTDFEKIYINLKIQPLMLKKIAEKEEFNKALEIGILDLVSFDVLDSRNRPFRMKKPIFHEYVVE